MIPNIVRGSDPAGLVRYLFGKGRRNEHTDQHLVCASGDMSPSFDMDGNPAESYAEIGRRFDRRYRVRERKDDPFPPDMRGKNNPEREHGRKRVWHCSLAIKAGQGILTDQEWEAVIRDYLTRMNIIDGDDATFFVDSRLTGQWTGYDHDRIVDAVMCAPVNGVDDAASRISFLKDQGLPESSHADNRATGDEPSTVSEVERTENADAAPIIGTTAPVKAHTKPAADERKPASEPEPETTGGGDLVTGEPDGYEEMPLDLNEPESWSGPDPFGEYSPAMESSMNPTDQPIPDQTNVPMPQILQPETNGNAR